MDKAIEFAEYMAKRAEELVLAIDELHKAQNKAEENNNYAIFDERVEMAQESLSECWSRLESSIYEFRKRAKRCTPSVESKREAPQ